MLGIFIETFAKQDSLLVQRSPAFARWIRWARSPIVLRPHCGGLKDGINPILDVAAATGSRPSRVMTPTRIALAIGQTWLPPVQKTRRDSASASAQTSPQPCEKMLIEQ
jgi:hypothetical protein